MSYSAAIADEICNRIADGEPLRQICRSEGFPAWRTVYLWMENNPDFAARIARARVLGFDAIAEDTLQMLDEEPARTATQFGDKVDAGYVAWQRSRVDQRMRLLAKWDPARFGERIQTEHSGGLTLKRSATDYTDDELACIAAGKRTDEA